MTRNVHLYVAAHPRDATVLERNLAISPEVARGMVPYTPLWGEDGVPGRYARALASAKADILVFAHTDVYFPDGWFDRLAQKLAVVYAHDPDWAVVSVLGRTKSGQWVGRIWDTSLRRVIGEPTNVPIPITAMDELAFIVRRASGIQFDTKLPTDIHLYGTDLILEAARLGKMSYGLDLPLLHNAKPGVRFAKSYIDAYKYMVRKWSKDLPIPTTTVPLVRGPWLLQFRRLRVRYKAIFRSSTFSSVRLADLHGKAAELGF
jgi:hypothetical protein